MDEDVVGEDVVGEDVVGMDVARESVEGEGVESEDVAGGYGKCQGLVGEGGRGESVVWWVRVWLVRMPG